jgi:hypothetical protein
LKFLTKIEQKLREILLKSEQNLIISQEKFFCARKKIFAPRNVVFSCDKNSLKLRKKQSKNVVLDCENEEYFNKSLI